MRQSLISASGIRNGDILRMDDWRRSVLERIGTELQILEEYHPRSYLLIAMLCAVAGYAFLLLFPGLVLTGIAALHTALFASQAPLWDQALAWTAVTGFAALVSYRLFRFRPAPPGGMPVDENTAPALRELVTTQNGCFNGTRIDRIVLSGEFELDIVKTPLWGLPVWSAHTLIIGRPLIQCLSPLRFQCALARRLGQFSKRNNRLQNWLYQLREIWPRYAEQPLESGFGYQPVRWFFLFYAPLYEVISAAAARLEELAADSYAMELFSDTDVLDTITTEMICRMYLREKFWPAIRKIAASEQQAITGFHAGMVSVLRTGLQDNRVSRWTREAMSADTPWYSPVPSLTRRVENIGHLKGRMEPLDAESAATVYLGNIPDKPSRPHPGEAAPVADPPDWPHRRWLAQLMPWLLDRLKKRHAGATAVQGE